MEVEQDESANAGEQYEDGHLEGQDNWFCSEAQALPVVVESLDVFAAHLTSKVGRTSPPPMYVAALGIVGCLPFLLAIQAGIALHPVVLLPENVFTPLTSPHGVHGNRPVTSLPHRVALPDPWGVGSPSLV